jgi:nickel/cobalt transporter (NicO) family protein
MLKSGRPSFARLAVATGVVLCITGGAVLAQSPLGIGTAEPSVDTGGFLSGFFAWVNAHQQSFYRALTGALSAMRDDPWQLWGLIGLSFAYGVFHAAGPGHGKAVISAYMVANEVALRRGVILSFASALLQGLVALLVVGAAYLVLRGSAVSMTDATRGLEIASFALVAAFGAWLLLRKLSSFRPAGGGHDAVMAHATAGVSAHHHHVPGDRQPIHHRDAHDHHDHDHERHHHAHAHHDHGHGHGHGHGEACSTCGHVHAPDPSLLRQERLSLGDAWSAVVAVGLRPCSGALIVLTFALLNGLYLGGVLSVLAMSIGTAITVAILASMAVGAKSLAIRYAGAGQTATRVTDGIEIFGALCVLVLGIVLLTAALSA